MKHDVFGLSSGNFGEQRMGCYKREFLFYCEIAIFYTSLKPLQPFLVKGTELYKC